MKALCLCLLLSASGCALSFGQPQVCYVFPEGARRCFASDEERRAWMSRDFKARAQASEIRAKRQAEELREKVRLRAAALKARDAVDEADLTEEEVFDMQVEMSEQARGLAGDAPLHDTSK